MQAIRKTILGEEVTLYWQNRVLERIDDKGTSYEETNLYVVEVFYHDDGSVLGWTEKEYVWGENIESLRQTLAWMGEALDKPILIEADLLKEAEEARAEGKEDIFSQVHATEEELLSLNEVLDSLGLEREDLERWADNGGPI